LFEIFCDTLLNQGIGNVPTILCEQKINMVQRRYSDMEGIFNRFSGNEALGD